MKHIKTYEGFKYMKPKSKEDIEKSILDILNNSKGNINLSQLKEFPEGFENFTFNNKGNVDLYSLISLPKGVVFNNDGYVDLHKLTTLSEGIKFNNKGGVDLSSISVLTNDVKFNNIGNVYFNYKINLINTVNINNKGEIIKVCDVNIIISEHEEDFKKSIESVEYVTHFGKDMSGSHYIEFKNCEGYVSYCTPFWEGSQGIPIEVNDIGEDFIKCEPDFSNYEEYKEWFINKLPLIYEKTKEIIKEHES